MTEETKPTVENEEIVAEEVASVETETATEVDTEVDTVTVEEEGAMEERPKAAASAETSPVAEDSDSDEDDSDDDFDDDIDDDGDDDDLTRRVEGPNVYAPREKRGRFQRIGRDIKMADINYKNVAVLSRFLDPRGRILSRRKTRVSAKIQRAAAREIKRARHLALLPYTADQTRITRKRGR